MTITVVSDVLGEENNGTTIAAMNLIRFLRSRGHRVRILCADQYRKGDEDTFVVPNLDLGRLLNGYVERVGVTLAKVDEDIVREAIVGTDHVHIMLPFMLGVKACEVAWEMGISTTAGFHMQAENFTSHLKLNKLEPLNNAVYRYIYDSFYQFVDAIHYPTDFIRNLFESKIGRKTAGYVISNGVNGYVERREVRRPPEYEGKIIILSTGRFSREKSQDTLIRAIGYSKHRDRIQLILGGKGPKEDYYKRLGRSLPLPPVLNFFSREEIIDVLNYSDIYVHPAEVELEGISCLEAISCGKLTIVSDSKRAATVGFAVDERCIFKNRDPKSLAAVIDYFIDNPEAKRECEEKYLASKVAYNQEDCMLRMEEMIKEVYRGKKSNIL